MAYSINLSQGIKVMLYISAASKDSWISCQCQRSEPDGSKDELCQGLAVSPWLWSLSLCCQISWREERWTVRGGIQQAHEDDNPIWGSHQDMEVQHNKGEWMNEWISSLEQFHFIPDITYVEIHLLSLSLTGTFEIKNSSWREHFGRRGWWITDLTCKVQFF